MTARQPTEDTAPVRKAAYTGQQETDRDERTEALAVEWIEEHEITEVPA